MFGDGLDRAPVQHHWMTKDIHYRKRSKILKINANWFNKYSKSYDRICMSWVTHRRILHIQRVVNTMIYGYPNYYNYTELVHMELPIYINFKFLFMFGAYI